jgi:hypothetical protein
VQDWQQRSAEAVQSRTESVAEMLQRMSDDIR